MRCPPFGAPTKMRPLGPRKESGRVRGDILWADLDAVIKRRDGTEFEIAPVRRKASPLDVEGIGLKLSAEEIVSAIGETRARETGRK